MGDRRILVADWVVQLVLLLSGVGLIIGGLAMWLPWVAMVVAGAICVFGAYAWRYRNLRVVGK